MKRTIHIVDYGIGNLYSVCRAVEAVGGEPILTRTPEEILGADRILLPGVGAYQPCIATLKRSGLDRPVVEFAASGKPFLGICVGMQLLFDYSLEFGKHEGLGLIPGHVAPIARQDAAGKRKVPHIGWSALQLPESRADWSDTLLEGLPPGLASLYFVHSFGCVPEDSRHRLAEVDYLGYPICAAVQVDNITGFQCHPEKSGPVGLKIVERFLAQ